MNNLGQTPPPPPPATLNGRLCDLLTTGNLKPQPLCQAGCLQGNQSRSSDAKACLSQDGSTGLRAGFSLTSRPWPPLDLLGGGFPGWHYGAIGQGLGSQGSPVSEIIAAILQASPAMGPEPAHLQRVGGGGRGRRWRGEEVSDRGINHLYQHLS